MIAMLQGDFGAAWRENDAIRARGAPDPHRMWEGEDLAGKRVIVRCLHGFGDTVQFARYARLLQQRAAEVVWEVSPAMADMARCFQYVHRVVTWGDDRKRGEDYEAQIEIMELPYLFRTTIADLPIAVNYIRLPRAMVQRAAREMGISHRPRVGVVWSAGTWNESRSIPIEIMRTIIEGGECEFWNLQGGAYRCADPGLRAALRDAPVCNDGVLSLAAAISQMDLVLTADTLAAHLAGALGVPVWLMLQHAADWRWMTERDDSPWYPSMQVFRQPFPGAWAEVASEISATLRLWTERAERRLA
jgi:ADP-heptose:LPS heptosyltransferase